MTTNVCVSGMECVCARPDGVRMCIWDAVCAHLRARVTGHKPVCLCVSLGVSQRGSGCRNGVLEGVYFGWGDRECRGPGAPDRPVVSACEAVGSRSPSLPPRLGPRCPDSLAPAPSHSHPLAHKDFSRWRLSATRSPARKGPEPAGGWDSADPRARGPARGGRRRRPAERRVPGDPGPRARRPERPPSRRPAFLAGLIPPLVGGPPRASTQRAYRVRPCPGAVPLGLYGSKSAGAVACTRRVPEFRKSQAAAPRPPGSGPGIPGRAAQVRRPRARKPDPRDEGLRHRAPRR